MADDMDVRLRIIEALIPVAPAAQIGKPSELIARAVALEKYVREGADAAPTSQNATTMVKEQPDAKTATRGKPSKDTSHDPFA